MESSTNSSSTSDTPRLSPSSDPPGASTSGESPALFQRYKIDTAPTDDLQALPPRFLVKVRRFNLAKMLADEFRHHYGKWDVAFQRPCVYGVFSGPLAGFWAQEEKCVGCLRCTIQYPDIVRILPNPEREAWADEALTLRNVEALFHEASRGTVPVKGQGYRGCFGGEGWEGMWTDMSEIVRPTRDGIHGREFISTAVDLGKKPTRLSFDAAGLSQVGEGPKVISLPLPMLFDAPPLAHSHVSLARIFASSARALDTLAVLPLDVIKRAGVADPHIVPLVSNDQVQSLISLKPPARMIELDGWDSTVIEPLRNAFPESILTIRLGLASSCIDAIEQAYQAGIRCFHLAANYHGQGIDGGHIRDLLIEIHQKLVALGWRDEVTLIGSGGLVAADHVPKAIIAGADAVALDTPLFVALQGQMRGAALDRESASFQLPSPLPVSWGEQRLKNLCAAWRDQTLEILGAMGMREVRRLRGELGRAMFQRTLEAEAFGEIDGYA